MNASQPYRRRSGRTAGPVTAVSVTSSAPTRVMRGQSAYEAAVADGFVGTEEQWLASLDGTAAVTAHIAAAEPHPAYDDLPDLTLIYENRKV